MLPSVIVAFISCHFSMKAGLFCLCDGPVEIDFRPVTSSPCGSLNPVCSEQVQRCSTVSMEMLKLDQRPAVSLIKGWECFFDFVCFSYRYSWCWQWGRMLIFLSVCRTLRVGEKPEAQCISTCNCFTSSISPVCGSNGITYLSACFAGCTGSGSSQITSSISQVFSLSSYPSDCTALKTTNWTAADANFSFNFEIKAKESLDFVVLSSAITCWAVKFCWGNLRSDADCRLASSIFKSQAREFLSAQLHKISLHCFSTAAVTAVILFKCTCQMQISCSSTVLIQGLSNDFFVFF